MITKIDKCECGRGKYIQNICCAYCKKNNKKYNKNICHKCGGLKYIRSRRCRNCLNSNNNSQLTRIKNNHNRYLRSLIRKDKMKGGNII